MSSDLISFSPTPSRNSTTLKPMPPPFVHHGSNNNFIAAQISDKNLLVPAPFTYTPHGNSGNNSLSLTPRRRSQTVGAAPTTISLPVPQITLAPRAKPQQQQQQQQQQFLQVPKNLLDKSDSFIERNRNELTVGDFHSEHVQETVLFRSDVGLFRRVNVGSPKPTRRATISVDTSSSSSIVWDELSKVFSSTVDSVSSTTKQYWIIIIIIIIT